MRAPKNVAPILPTMPFEKCLAKSIDTGDGSRIPGSTVAEHCLDAGFVARELISRIRPRLRKRLYPEGCELIAALHDIGKVSPGFQAKIFSACDLDAGLGVGADFDRLAGYHVSVGAAALSAAGPFIADIVGRHHGSSPEFLAGREAEIYGGPSWQAERERLRSFLEERMGACLPGITNEAMADAVSGLVTVSDWIASGEARSDGSISEADRASGALDRAGLVVPSVRAGLSFRHIFDFDANRVQLAVEDLAAEGGVLVVEAPMGLGKTEAALYAAYKLLANGKASGLYFALPTRATSDRMRERMDRFLAAILGPDERNRSARLLHGQAWLRETDMGEEGAPGGSWFDSSKRGILSPFCVGTIDQALLAVMNVRFGFVRSFGLAGKVVVLDEVHSYDCYTGTLLDALVRSLRELGSTVIILSATLSRSRRDELLEQKLTQGRTSTVQGETTAKENYPLVSASTPSGKMLTRSVPAVERSDVWTRIVNDYEEALGEALDRALSGQQVLWIENTVGEAQSSFALLAARASDNDLPCGLLHSRFTAIDREAKELEWVNLYGKPGIPRREVSGRILVGTQVLEQSLDIDADFLVSRLAPTDLLLQRIGRLWRHRENDAARKALGARRETWILAPTLSALEGDRRAAGNSAFVYAPYVLCRTLEILGRLDRIALPDDIRGLIEDTYAEREENPALSGYLRELEGEKEKLKRLARGGLGSGGKTISDDRAPTRYAERESRDLLLLKSFRRKKGALSLATLAGETLELREPAPAARDRRRTAATLCRNLVSIPSSIAPVTTRASVLELSPYLYLGREDESAVAVAVAGEDGLLRTVLGEEFSSGKRVSYDSYFGFRSAAKTNGGIKAWRS